MRHTTVDRNTLNSRPSSKLLDHIIDLLCKLTCRSENERLASLLFTCANFFKYRKDKRCGLSRTGLSESDDVMPLYRERNCFRLDGSRGFVADRLNRFLKEISKRKIVKGIRADLFRS